MKYTQFKILVFNMLIAAFFLVSCTSTLVEEADNFKVGWAAVDITPGKPVLVSGQFHARVSEGVMDPIYATALAMESGSGPNSEKAIMISCDLVSINDDLRNGSDNNVRDNVRKMVTDAIPGLDGEKIILFATHTHTAPLISSATDSESIYGVKLDAMPPAECLETASRLIAEAAIKAWENRESGGVSYGLGYAVVARNRIQASLSGGSIKGGTTNRPDFSHIEGYEDHAVKMLFTWDNKKNLTGVVVNIHTDPQATGDEFAISSDFWHETREGIREKLGKDVFVLPQCSAAGDQGTLVLVGARAENRMNEIMYPVSDTIDERLRPRMTRRKAVASRITDAVTSVFPYMEEHIEWDPAFHHRMEVIELSRRLISMEDVNSALEESEKHRERFEKLLEEINENPGIKNDDPRWYRYITRTYRLMMRGQSVKERYELEKVQPRLPIEVHVLRIGDVVFATNPFELYLDYASRIKARSPAIQTFVVQLAGGGTYLPTERSVAGGAYGAVPASTLIGPEGGLELVESTLVLIDSVWGND